MKVYGYALWILPAIFFCAIFPPSLLTRGARFAIIPLYRVKLVSAHGG